MVYVETKRHFNDQVFDETLIRAQDVHQLFSVNHFLKVEFKLDGKLSLVLLNFVQDIPQNYERGGPRDVSDVKKDRIF